jgi:diguanylate cyclase (GGDEF)-like protein/PAS domain S-box-containing protein
VKLSESAAGLVSDRLSRAEVYRSIVAKVPHVLLVVDETGQILDVTDEVTSKLGYGVTDVVGRPVFDFLHPDQHQIVAVRMLHEMSSPLVQADSMVCRLAHADGHWMEFEVHGFNHLDNPAVGGLLVSLRDISERRLGDRILAAGDYLYSFLDTIASDGTTIFDSTGRRVYSSPSLVAMLGYSRSELDAIPPRGLVHPDDISTWRRATQLALATENGIARGEVRLLRSDGSPVWIEATVVNLLHDAGVSGVVVHARNIDDRRRMEVALRQQATTDALTGLANRHALMDRLEVISSSSDDCGADALLFIDLDSFKLINDTHGHGAGDEVLRSIAEAIRECVRPRDFVARIGGDEFCVVASGVESPAAATSMAEVVRDRIIALSTDDRRIGASIGIAWVQAATDADRLLTAADRAMYRAKKRGTNLIEAVTLGADAAM